jgi:hypothetical protein
MPARLPRSNLALAILLGLFLPSCFLQITTDSGDFTIAGHLSTDCGCRIVECSRGTFGLQWPGEANEIPPLGSRVTLRVRHIGGSSPCAGFGMVEVIEVIEVAGRPE